MKKNKLRVQQKLEVLSFGDEYYTLDWFSLRLNNCNNAVNAKPPMCNKLQLNKLTTCKIIEVPKNEHMLPRNPNSLQAWLNFYINIDVLNVTDQLKSPQVQLF